MAGENDASVQQFRWMQGGAACSSLNDSLPKSNTFLFSNQLSLLLQAPASHAVYVSYQIIQIHRRPLFSSS